MLHETVSYTFKSVCFDITAVWCYVVCRYARDRYARFIIDAPTVASRIVALRLLEESVLFTLRYEDVSVWISPIHFLCFLSLFLARPQSSRRRCKQKQEINYAAIDGPQFSLMILI